jgi:hypothetical protein
MYTFNPQAYGPICQELLTEMPLCELSPATPNLQQQKSLVALTPESFANGRKIRDRQMALCCLSGLWLLHNFLDDSHTISQDMPTTSGSYWHALMHRREPDFENAKYWFRRVGRHPIEDDLHQAAQQILAETCFGSSAAGVDPQFPAESSERKSPTLPSSSNNTTYISDGTTNFLAKQTKWDAFRFVDLCEAAFHGRSNAGLICRRIAEREWQLLFDHCYHGAVGE